MSELVLGIDVGTSSSKGVLVRPDGTVVARAERAHGVSFPRAGFVEQDAEVVWWGGVLTLCAELVPQAAEGAIQAVCVSGTGPCLVPCDAQLRPLRPAILYGIDTRAAAETVELEGRLGTEAILARGGSALSSQALGPKLLWLRRHEPDVWERMASWHMPSSFVAARLSGEVALDHHSASQCDPLYDLAAGGWAVDWADAVVPGCPLPPLVWPGEPVGAVTPAAAAETGLAAGTPVLAGTIDAWAEALSVGVRRPGDLMLMYGSTMFLVQVADAVAAAPPLWCTQGLEPGRPTYAAGMSTSGTLVEWWRGLMGSPDWDALLGEAAASPPGARGVVMLPYFAGERTPVDDPRARGVVAGLTLSHGRGDVLRAAYEGIALGVRQIVGLLGAAGGAAERVVAVGGGTRASLFTQIVSDATGVAQELPAETFGASYGDAFLAATGTGLVDGDTDWTRMVGRVEPDPAAAEVYAELALLYRDLYPATSPIVHALADHQGAVADGH